MKESHIFEIQYYFKGNCRSTLNTAERPEIITIGRAEDCTIRLDPEDASASSHHAVLSLNAKGWILEDQNSRNKMYCNGKTISRLKIADGMKISIGEGYLLIREVKVKHVSFDMLEQLNTSQRGKLYAINCNCFNIGSGADNELVLSDTLISAHHVQINLKNQSNECWITDLNSKNGTLINQTPLRGNERLLQHGDLITIGYVDFRFLSKNVPHVRSYFWLKVTSALVSTAFLVSGYFIYISLQKDALHWVDVSRRLAAEEEFQQSRNVLTTAGEARDAQINRATIEEMTENLNRWENTLEAWEAIKENLKKRLWISAVRQLSELQQSGMTAWSWNQGSAIALKNTAFRIKILLDSYTFLQAGLENPDFKMNDMISAQKSLQSALSVFDEQVDPYLHPLISAAGKLLTQTQDNIQNQRLYEETLQRLDENSPNFKLVITRLSELESVSYGNVKMRIESCITPLEGLSTIKDQLLDISNALSNLRFDALRIKIELPSENTCSVHPLISQQRAILERRLKNLIKGGEQAQYMYSELVKMGFKNGQIPPVLTEILDTRSWEPVIGCDVLEYKLPARNRTKPSGHYDNFLGLEYAYDYWDTLHEKYQGTALGAIRFTPKAVEARRMFTAASDMIQHFSSPENRWMYKGKIKTYIDSLQYVLAQRDELVNYLISRNAEKTSREYLVSRGSAILLCPKAFDKASLDGYMASFKAHKQKLSQWGNAYEEAPPERAVEIRKKMMQEGIPGNAQVRRVWATIQEGLK